MIPGAPFLGELADDQQATAVLGIGIFPDFGL